MMRLRWPLLALFIVAGAAARDEGRLLEHLRYLASDELQGRGNGSPGMEQAARFLAEEYRRIGLEPGGSDGTFFQPFTITTGQNLGSDNRLEIRGPRIAREFSIGTEYKLLAYGPEPSVSGELFFAGFGITTTDSDLGYDDYGDWDVRGRVILAFEHEPQERLASSPFHGKDLTPYSTVIHKALNARSRGAVALILIPDRFNHPKRGSRQAPQMERVANVGIPTVRLTGRWGERLLREAGRDPSEIDRWLHHHLTPYSFPMDGVSVRLDADVVPIRHEVRNVVGVLPGDSEEAVVIGAHYDHLGLGDESSLAEQHLGQIHNGADDNASGVAGMLVLARDFSAARPGRTLVFAAFAAEELGLLGSRHYVQHPPHPLEHTVAMVNLDMIGRSDGDVLIGGVGTAEEFRDLLHEVEVKSPLTFKYASTPRGSSDHLSFATAGVPVLFFFTGLHPDYHKPSDDWEKIDLVRTWQVVEAVRQTVDRLSRLESRPRYVDLRQGRPPLDDRPWLGIAPDMSWTLGGVRIAQVLSWSPAHDAGLQESDVLVEFGGREVRNLRDLRNLLRSRKPGDQVRILVLRQGRLVEMTARLDRRSAR